MDKLFYLFYGAIFIAFGLGVTLTQLTDIPNGFIFLGLGFLILIIGFIIGEENESTNNK